MTVRTEKALSLIAAGVQLDLDATDRTSDNLIVLARAIAAHGTTPRILNAGTKTSDSIMKIHTALGGNVFFSGV